jgi:hypothetical protein
MAYPGVVCPEKMRLNVTESVGNSDDSSRSNMRCPVVGDTWFTKAHPAFSCAAYSVFAAQLDSEEFKPLSGKRVLSVVIPRSGGALSTPPSFVWYQY